MSTASEPGYAPPAPNGVQAADLPPGAVLDAIKDSIALIRACAVHDDEGILAIVMGTDNLPYALAMTAAAAAIICRRGELDDLSIAPFLDSVASELTDRLLDQQLSREGGD